MATQIWSKISRFYGLNKHFQKLYSFQNRFHNLHPLLWKHNSSCNLVLKRLQEQCRHRVSGFRDVSQLVKLPSHCQFCWSCSNGVASPRTQWWHDPWKLVPKWPRTVWPRMSPNQDSATFEAWSLQPAMVSEETSRQSGLLWWLDWFGWWARLDTNDSSENRMMIPRIEKWHLAYQHANEE